MSIGTIVTIAGYAILGIILLCSFFIGYKRRFIRGSVNFVISLALVVVAYFITPVISKAILGISVGDKALSQYIVDLISGIDAVGNLVDKSEAFKAFLESVPMLLANVVVFIVLYLIMRLLGYIIYKVIDVTCLKKKMEKPTYNAKRDKWLGGGLGIVKGLVFTVIVFAPITSLVGMVSDLKTGTEPLYTAKDSTASSTLSEEGEEGESSKSIFGQSTGDIIDEFVPSIVMEIVDGYNKSGLGVVTGAFGVDDLIFDQLVKFDVEGEAITLRKDLMNVAVLYNTYAEMKEAVDNPNGQSFKDANWDAIDQKVNEVLESGFVKGLVTNLMGDFIENYEEMDLLDEEYNAILASLKETIANEEVEEYFLHDFKCMYKVVSDAGRGGLLDALLLSEDKLDEVLASKNKEALKKVVDDVLSINILKDAVEPVYDLVSDKVGSNSLGEINIYYSEENWVVFKNAILDVIDKDVLVNLNKLGVFDLLSDGKSTSEMIGTIAENLKGADNESNNALKNAFLGMYEINALRTSDVFQEVKKILSSTGFIVIDNLEKDGENDLPFETAYANWENDLTQIENLLIAANTITIKIDEEGNTETVLEALLEESEKGENADYTKVIDSILNEDEEDGEDDDEDDEDGDDETAINNLIRPIFKAKSMSGIVDKLEDSYPEIENLLGSKDADDIDFAKLLKATKLIKNASDNSFLSDLQDLVTTTEEVNISDITDMISNASAEEIENIETVIDAIGDYAEDYLTDEDGEIASVISGNQSEIEEALNKNSDIEDDLADKIRAMLGLEQQGE